MLLTEVKIEKNVWFALLVLVLGLNSGLQGLDLLLEVCQPLLRLREVQLLPLDGDPAVTAHARHFEHFRAFNLITDSHSFYALSP